MFTMELAHRKYNKMDRERQRKERGGVAWMSRKKGSVVPFPYNSAGPYSKQRGDPEWPRSSKLSGFTWK